MDNQYRQFVQDAAAFLRFGFANNLDDREMFVTLVHDISGLARRERCFTPRVDGYALEETKHTNNNGKATV